MTPISHQFPNFSGLPRQAKAAPSRSLRNSYDKSVRISRIRASVRVVSRPAGRPGGALNDQCMCGRDSAATLSRK